MAEIPPSLAPPPTVADSFRIEQQRREQGKVLVFSGRLTFAEATPLWDALRATLQRTRRREPLELDMQAVEWLDGGAMALLAHFRAELHRRGVRAEFTGAAPAVQEIIHLYRGDQRVPSRRRRKPRGTLDQIGEATLVLVGEAQLMLAFVGQLLLALLGVVRHPKSANLRELSPTMERTGADAVPIVLLINFLVGLVMAFQASLQLSRFGANILVADLIGISVTRELGPLMTAIVVCGRSGAAFAAELGSMRVNEEVDALRTLGLEPMRFLVAPRLLALMLVLPLLALLADVMGVVGGLVVAVISLDLTPVAYFDQLQKAVGPWDIGSGVIKAVAFAAAIALIACQQGLATEGGAEGVGRRTTSAVVSTLFALILIDAAFTVFFRVLER